MSCGHIEQLLSLNLPTATPYVFEFDDSLNLEKDYFLGDPEEIRKRMAAVEMCIRDRGCSLNALKQIGVGDETVLSLFRVT